MIQIEIQLLLRSIATNYNNLNVCLSSDCDIHVGRIDCEASLGYADQLIW